MKGEGAHQFLSKNNRDKKEQQKIRKNEGI